MEKIIIDTDPGVDDALAILLAASANEQLDIWALTTVDGNVGIDSVTANANIILELCGREEIPIYRGAKKPIERKQENCEEVHGDDGLGNVGLTPNKLRVEAEEASDYLVRIADEHKGELTLVPIGPLTNIARAVRKDPQFVHNIKRVVIMGGAEYGGNMTPAAEFNFWHDPEAAKEVMGAGFKDVTMVGLDATREVLMSPAVRELLYQIHTPISEFIHKITRVYSDSHWKYDKTLGCELCDPLVIGYLICPEILKLVEAYVDVETMGLYDGASIVYRTHLFPDKKPNCHVAVGADAKKFFEVFLTCQFPEYQQEICNLLQKEYSQRRELL